MELNIIKKDLYRQKPIAKLLYIRKGSIFYRAEVNGEDKFYNVIFSIPVEDIGDADFLSQMPSQQLIRWIKID